MFTASQAQASGDPLLPPPEPAASGDAEPTTLRERLHWMALGLGCTWFINDTIALQLPWWVAFQPEKLELGNYNGLVAAIVGPCAALLALLLRKYRPAQLQRFAVPTLICFSLGAGVLLASGVWRLSSWFIYLAVGLSSCVGGLTPFVTVPWVVGSGYKSALISPMYLGGSVGSLLASLLAIYQAPGVERRFSPAVFFAIITVPVAGSLLAFLRIRAQGIGRSATTSAASETLPDPPAPEAGSGGAVEASCAAVPEAWDGWLPRNYRLWGWSALPLALWMGFIGLCTWNVSRAVMGFAAVHTVSGHHTCRGLPPAALGGPAGCALLCSRRNETGCSADNLCTASVEDGAFACKENQGEVWIGWITSLAQWAYSGGIALTVAFPSYRLWRVSAVWLAAFVVLLVPALRVSGGGFFEAAWGGPLVLLGALLLRGSNGYLETMQWRYIAHRWGSEAQSVSLAFGAVSMAISLFGSLASTALIEAGLIGN